MKRALIATVGAALLGLTLTASADDAMMMKQDQMMMKQMDTNGDGKISKDEYMAYHEKMWASMKKDSDGMVDGKSMMMMMHKGMMDKSMSTDSGGH